MKKLLLLIGSAFLLLLAVLLFNTFTSSSSQPSFESVTGIDVAEKAVANFQQAIQYQTISYTDRSRMDTASFIAFQEFLEETYPLVHEKLEKQLFNYTSLFTWKGSDPTAPGLVMMGHYDVVPVDSNTMGEWEEAPFSGTIREGKIYGRGTLDDKINVIAALEAVEALLAEGYAPKKTIYLSFGHDEEIGGDQGAKLVAEHLKAQKANISFAIDEGGFIAGKEITQTKGPVAIINTGEKGYVSYKLTINTPGGHSSNPPADNTIGSLAKAIAALEENQFPYRVVPVMKTQMERMAPAMNNFGMRMAMANPWLFGSFVAEFSNAHTTTAPTIIEGGVKDNVIPTQASVVVNFRIMPGETGEDIEKHIHETVNDERIKLELYDILNEASPISDHNSESFKLLERTIIELFPEVTVSPGLLGGGTDSKHFIGIADQVYRFYPTRIDPECLTCFHGNNEHISVANYKETIQFNYQLIRNFCEL